MVAKATLEDIIKQLEQHLEVNIAQSVNKKKTSALPRKLQGNKTWEESFCILARISH